MVAGVSATRVLWGTHSLYLVHRPVTGNEIAAYIVVTNAGPDLVLHLPRALLVGSYGDAVFADRIEQVKKTKFEVELIKNVDRFLDGYGNYDSNLFFLKLNLCKLTTVIFKEMNPVEIDRKSHHDNK